MVDRAKLVEGKLCDSKQAEALNDVLERSNGRAQSLGKDIGVASFGGLDRSARAE